MAEDPGAMTSRSARRVERGRISAREGFSFVTELPYSDDWELKEAVENFRCYLEILQLWDQREKQHRGAGQERKSGLSHGGGMV